MPHTQTTIAGSGIPDPAEVHTQLDRRVSNVESWMGKIEKSIERVEVEGKAGQARLESKLDEQTALLSSKLDGLATRQLAGQRTNWGVIASWTAVGVTLVSAIGFAYTRPGEQTNDRQDRAIERLEAREREDFERSVRNEERLNAMREFGLGMPAAAGTPRKGGA